MWYTKMYFSGEKEFFENDAFGMQGLPSKQLELPFLESLLTFLELDEKEITPMLERISVNWERFVESRDREAIYSRDGGARCTGREAHLPSPFIYAQLRLLFRKWLRSSGNSGDYFGSKGVCKAVFRDKEAG